MQNKAVVEGYQLSPQQTRIWWLRQADGGQAYRAQSAALIGGNLNVEILKAAISKVVNRHEILRTNFHLLPGMAAPLQWIESDPIIEFREFDLTDFDSHEKSVRFEELFRAEAIQGLDLKPESAARFCLVHLSGSERALMTSLPAMCADSRSLKILFREIARAYAAGLGGAELSGQPVQYVDFAEWQGERLEQEVEKPERLGRQIWPSPSASQLMLGLERESKTSDGFEPNRISFVLDARTTTEIDRLSSTHRASSEVFLLACWQILVWRLTGCKELTIDYLCEGRRKRELQDAAGIFARFCPIQSDIEPDYQFTETLEFVGQAIKSAQARLNHLLRQDCRVMDDGRPADRSDAIGYEYEEWPAAESAGSVEFRYWKQSVCIDRFKLKLAGYRKADGLTIEIQYDPAIFTRESVEIIRERYLKLIESAVERERAPIEELEIVGRRDAQTKVREGWRIGQSIRAGEKNEAAPLVRIERQVHGGVRAPLSFAQQRLWFLDQLAPNNPFYNVPGSVRLEGRLDIEALERAINEIVRRHEVLRTRFELEEGEPVQLIDPWEPRRLEVEDLTSLTPKEREEEVGRISREEAETGFDLSKGPLLRVKVLKLEVEQYVLLYTMHHIVSDGWSMGILNREVGALYQAYSGGEPSPLEELDIQYADYARWQREYLAGSVLENNVGYWKEQLKDAAILELPTDHPRPAAPSYRGGRERIELGREVSEGLKRLSQREGATLFMALMAAFKVVLMRYSGQEDLSVGTVIANRTRKEIEGLIGFFVNTLVMRTDLSGNPSFRESIGREREAALGAFARQEAPFEKLVEEINPERGLSRSPLFQVLMVLQNAERGESEIRGLKMSGIREEMGVAKFDLELTLTEEGEGIRGILGYSQDLYEGETIGRMARHYERVVTEVVRDAEQKICEIELMSEEEKRRLLWGWERAKVEYDRDRRIHHLFEEQVERSPEAVAIVYEEEQISYWELNRRANRLGRCLQKQGVGPEVLVGVCLERSIEMVAAALGVWKAGGVYVPMDPSYPEQRLRLMMEEVSVCVFGDEGRESGAPGGCQARALSPGEAWSEAEECWEEACESDVSGENAAYVIYTSGSSGEPKGVVVAHRNLSNMLKVSEETFGFETGEEMLCLASFSFDISLFELLNPLVVGGKVNLLNREQILDMGRLLGEMKKASVVHAVPTLMREVIEGIEREGEPSSGYGKIEKVFVGGELVPLELLREMERVFKGARIEVLYGPTEGTVICSSDRVVGGEPRGKNLIGRPLSNQVIRIYDKVEELTPIGVKGEMRIGGAGVARGYLKRAELTAERFTPEANSEEPGARVYRTGDLGRYGGDGKIEFLGRGDGQVKIRGYRIELGEIESRLAQHPAIREAVALVHEDSPHNKRLVAYYTVAEAEATVVAIDAGALRAHLSAALPEHMLPTAYVELEALPITPNGKLDRRALPAPDSTDYAASEYEAPVGATETALANIWAETLKLERVGRYDNFFELGGHSMLAVRMVERMRREGLQADVRTLFEAPTLAALAAAVSDRSGIVDVPPNLIPSGCEAITPEMLPLTHLSADEIALIVSSVPGGAANVQDIYPLAPLQEGILFHHLLETEGDVYLNPSLLAFDSRALLDRFLQALQAVINRHDILRTAILWEGLSEPVQVVWRRAPLAVEKVSLDPTAGDAAEELSARFDPRRYRLDVRQAPLMRVYIAEDARKDRWVMLHMFHHLSGDHTTLEVLLQEIQAHLLGRAEQLPAPPPFRNFIAQARLGVSRQEHEAFFRAMLGDVDEPTAPYGLIDAQGDGSGIIEIHREVEAGLSLRLRQRARALGASAASLCHLACAQVLGRVSGRDDVVFGTVMFGRMQGGEGADWAPGMFINTLPVRIRVGAQSVEESVRQTHQSLTELITHEYASLSLAQRCSAVEAPTPLFSAIFNYRHSAAAETVAGAAEDRLRAWEGIEMLSSEDLSNYPLSLCMDDLGEGFALKAQAQSPVEPDRICAYMHMALEQLVEALERTPSIPLRDLNVLPDSERRQLLVEWNSTERSYRNDRYLHELIAEQAKRNGEAIAVKSEEGELSYGELNRRANQVGRYLQRLGVGPEVLVGVYLERSVEMVVGLLGVLNAGGAYMPLDPESPLERLGYMLEDAGVGVVLTQRALEARLPALWGQTVLLDEDWERIGGESESEPESMVDAENPAYVLYTSGSTGRPKGVVISHGAILNHMLWMQEAFPLDERDCVLQKTPFSFDASVWEFYAPLLVGGLLVMSRPGGHLDSAYLVRLIVEREVTILQVVPSMLRMLLDEVELEKCRSLKRVFCGGEALTRDLQDRFFSRLPVELHNLYGPTEATIDAITWSCRRDEKSARAIVPIGRPIANAQAYVLDERLEPAPVGVVGALYLGGRGIGQGYLRQPEMTAERFIPHRFSSQPGERLYETRDSARYLPDGNLEFMGRADYQVKFKGYRIELDEISRVLEQELWIKEAVTVVRKDDHGVEQLVAYLVVDGERKEEMKQLRNLLKEKLPNYMIPMAIMALEKMPLTPNGKLDRKALPSPERERGEIEAAYVPRTPVEELLVGIFQEVLNLDPVGIRDDFFELGGHSLLATQIVSRVKKAFGVEIGVRSIFEEPTVEGLARKVEELIRAGERETAPPLVRAPREGRLPLSFAQQRLWFFDQLAPNNPFYNIPGAARLEGRLNLKALEKVFNEIFRRHEVLRTRIEVEGGVPAQVIDEWRPQRLEVEDLTGLTPDEREAESMRITGAEAGSGFDLTRGPLMRVKVIKLEEEQHVALFTMHHIVSDGWSIGVLVREISALYEAMSEGKESPLPELEIQYADYAYWQRNYLKGRVMEEHLQYWKSHLGGKLPSLDLVRDRHRPPVNSNRGDAKSIALPVELSESLKALSLREGATLFMVMLAAFKTLLYKYTAESDIVVGAPIANRNRAEIENLIGFFINMLPMRTDLSGNPRFTELVRRVKDVALGAYAHQDLPLEKLVEEIQPERELGQLPLCNIAFGVQNAPQTEARLTGLKIHPVSTEHEWARTDLTLWISESGRAIHAGWLYRTDLFDEEAITRMHGHLEALLFSIVARPEAPLDELEMLSEAERARQNTNRVIREERDYRRFKSMKPRAVTRSED